MGDMSRRTWRYEDFLLIEITMVVPLPGDATQLGDSFAN